VWAGVPVRPRSRLRLPGPPLCWVQRWETRRTTAQELVVGAAGEEATPTSGGVAGAPTRVDPRHAWTRPAEAEERAQAAAAPLSVGTPRVVGPVAGVAGVAVEAPTRRSGRWQWSGRWGPCVAARVDGGRRWSGRWRRGWGVAGTRGRRWGQARWRRRWAGRWRWSRRVAGRRWARRRRGQGPGRRWGVRRRRPRLGRPTNGARWRHRGRGTSLEPSASAFRPFPLRSARMTASRHGNQSGTLGAIGPSEQASRASPLPRRRE
jgi:hypothetical protein